MSSFFLVFKNNPMYLVDILEFLQPEVQYKCEIVDHSVSSMYRYIGLFERGGFELFYLFPSPPACECLYCPLGFARTDSLALAQSGLDRRHEGLLGFGLCR